jgi:hypothetical protein
MAGRKHELRPRNKDETRTGISKEGHERRMKQEKEQKIGREEGSKQLR